MDTLHSTCVVIIDIDNKKPYTIHELTDSEIMGCDDSADGDDGNDGVDVDAALIKSLELPSDIKCSDNPEEHILSVWLDNPDSECPFTFHMLKSIIETMKCSNQQLLPKTHILQCIHLRQSHQCKECEGSSICKHRIERSKCKKCRGVSKCIHRRQKHQCKD